MLEGCLDVRENLVLAWMLWHWQQHWFDSKIYWKVSVIFVLMLMLLKNIKWKLKTLQPGAYFPIILGPRDTFLLRLVWPTTLQAFYSKTICLEISTSFKSACFCHWKIILYHYVRIPIEKLYFSWTFAWTQSVSYASKQISLKWSHSETSLLQGISLLSIQFKLSFTQIFYKKLNHAFRSAATQFVRHGGTQ